MESELIEWLRPRAPSNPQVVLGIGDDAAILASSNGGQSVVTCDTLTDGVDFRLPECDPRRVGRKALAVNLSDLAAMAARPIAAFVALVLPRAGSGPLATELLEGMIPLAEQFGMAIAGGDTNSWDGPLVISITAVGEVTEHGPLCRNGAQPGHEILVTGAFGGSLLGGHFDFQPRVEESLLLNASHEIRAAIDVSDGLSLDLWRVCDASGCGAVLDLESIPIAPAAHRRAAAEGGQSALDHALADGEDFELIMAVDRDEAKRLVSEQPLGVRLTKIGEFIETPGLWSTTTTGHLSRLEPRGFKHSWDT